MIETLTIGKRRAGIPSESGSIGLVCSASPSTRVGEIADALRETHAALPMRRLGRRFVIEDEDVDQRCHCGGDGYRQDHREASEHETHHGDGDERHEW